MGFADQIAAAVVVLAQAQLADGRSPVAELVKAAGHLDIVADQGPVRLGAKLGHHEQGDPLDPRRSPLDPGQQQVDDIVRPVMVAGRDEYFLPSQQIIALIGRLGQGAEVRQGAAGLGFGEGHGALPLAGIHPGNVGFLERIGTERFDQVGRPGGQHGVDAGRVVGGRKNKTADAGNQERQLLAAPFKRGMGGDPAPFPAGPHPSP